MDQINIPAADPLTDRADPERYFRTDRVKSGLKGQTIRGAAVTVGAESTKQVLWFISTVIMARMLTPRDSGIYAMVVVITGFIYLFNDLGLSAAVIQREKIDQQQVSALFWINLAVAVGLALLTAALAPAVAWFYGEPSLIGVTATLSLGFIFSGLTIQHRTLLRRQMRLRPLAIINVGAAVIDILVGITAAWAGLGYWSLVLMQLVSAPIEALAIWIVCGWRPSRPAGARGIRSMLNFGGHLMGYRLTNYLIRNVDNMLIGFFYGPGPLGLYVRAYTLLILPLNRVNTPISGVAIPALSRLAGEPERYRDAYLNIVAKVCLLTMPLIAWMLGTSDWLILVVLGRKWIESSQIFAWLGISGLIEPILYAGVWLFLTQGRSRHQFHWGVMSGALMVVAIVAGLPWGPIGVAASYGLVSLFIRLPLLFWYVGREGPVRARDLYGSLAPFACAVCATLLAIFAFRYWSGVDQPLIGLAATAGITALVSLLTLAILPSGQPAIRDLKSILKILMRPRLAA